MDSKSDEADNGGDVSEAGEPTAEGVILGWVGEYKERL